VSGGEGGASCYGIHELVFLNDGRFVGPEIGSGFLVGQVTIPISAVQEMSPENFGADRAGRLRVLGRPGTSEMRFLWERAAAPVGQPVGTSSFSGPVAARSIPEPELEIVSPAGVVVTRLTRSEVYPDRIEFRWSGRDEEDRRLPAGVYFARISGTGEESSGAARTSKLVLLR
jgi:hypothetical protein